MHASYWRAPKPPRPSSLPYTSDVGTAIILYSRPSAGSTYFIQCGRWLQPAEIGRAVEAVDVLPVGGVGVYYVGLVGLHHREALYPGVVDGGAVEVRVVDHAYCMPSFTRAGIMLLEGVLGGIYLGVVHAGEVLGKAGAVLLYLLAGVLLSMSAIRGW